MKKNFEQILSSTQVEIEQIEHEIEDLALATLKIKKNCLIAIIVAFLVGVTGVTSLSVCHFVSDNHKVKEYRMETKSKCEEFEQFLNSLGS